MISAVVFAANRAANAAEKDTPPRPGAATALERVLEGLLASKVGEVVCVVSDLESVRRQVAIRDRRLIWLVRYGADGDSHSAMVDGLWAADPSSDGVLFLPGDQSPIGPELVDALIERFEDSRASIVVPSFQGQTGSLLLIRRELFPDLLTLGVGRDIRALLDRNRDRTELVRWAGEIPIADAQPRADQDRLKEPV